MRGYFDNEVEKIGSPGEASQAITLIMSLLKGELLLQQEYVDFNANLKQEVEVEEEYDLSLIHI